MPEAPAQSTRPGPERTGDQEATCSSQGATSLLGGYPGVSKTVPGLASPGESRKLDTRLATLCIVWTRRAGRPARGTQTFGLPTGEVSSFPGFRRQW